MSFFFHMPAPQGCYQYKTALTIRPMASGSADRVLFLAVQFAHDTAGGTTTPRTDFACLRQGAAG